LGALEQGLVDAVAGKRLAPCGRFLLLAHADPDVGRDYVRAAHGLLCVGHELEPGGALRTESLGCADAQGEPEDPCRLDPRARHVGCAVAHPRDDLSTNQSESLLDREEVGEELHRMAAVGKAVDDRNGGRASELAQTVVSKRPVHDRVDVSRRDRTGIRERLSSRNLAFLRRQRDRGAAELPDCRLEAEARARGVLFEQEQESAAGERLHHLAAAACLLQLPGAPEQRGVLLHREVGKGEEVALHSSASRSCAKTSTRRGVERAASAARAARCSSEAICSLTCSGPVPPALRLRATDARGSAARTTSSSKRGSISRASASVAWASGSRCSWQRRTSLPTIWYAVRKATPFCARASATSVACV